MTDEELVIQFQNITNLIDASMNANAKEFGALHDDIADNTKKLNDLTIKVDENILRLDSIDRKLGAEVNWRDNPT